MVRARTLDGFATLVRELGGDPTAILARVGIAADATDRPLEWLSFPAVLRAYELAAAETRCEAFGMRLGHLRRLSYLGPLQLMVSYSRDLRTGFEAFCRFASVQNTGCQPSLEICRDEATFALALNPQVRRWGNQWVEESLVAALRLLRGCLGADYLPRRISLRHAAIGERASYLRHFGMAVCTNAYADGVTIDRRDLEVANARRDDAVLSVLTDYLRSDAVPARTDTAALVRGALRRSLEGGPLSIEAVAQTLGMHKRTLQRRLQEGGTSFADLLDEVRAEAARHYVASRTVPLTHVALRLGFSDQSAFNHAFRRWFHHSPTEWLTATAK